MAGEFLYAQSTKDVWYSGICSTDLLALLPSLYTSNTDSIIYNGSEKLTRYYTIMNAVGQYTSKIPLTYWTTDDAEPSYIDIVKDFIPILYKVNLGTYSGKTTITIPYKFFKKTVNAVFEIAANYSAKPTAYGIDTQPNFSYNNFKYSIGYTTLGSIYTEKPNDFRIQIPVYNDTRTQMNYLEFSISNNGKGVYANVVWSKNHDIEWSNSFFAQVGEGVLPSDPYASGGTSGSGGGAGSFDGTSDVISAPSVPTLGATTTGFVSLYNPTLAQVQELASYMWSDAFSIDSFKKLFADPMDTILGLSIVPVAVPDGETTTLKVGNLSTGISITRAGAQYITVDCGSIAVNEYWGAYLDYAPYTKLEIYLPYIGTHQLSADDVMGKTISVKYNVDILSGSCVAFVTCGDSVLYTFSGQCSQNIPITGEDFTSNLMGAISFAASAGAVVASGGGAAAVMPAAAGLTSSYINAFKPDIQRSGNIGGTSGMLGIQVPYLILTRPRQCIPENQNKYLGYPSFITEELSELSGYTEIEDIQLEGCTATDTEIDEIKSLLAGGVLL